MSINVRHHNEAPHRMNSKIRRVPFYLAIAFSSLLLFSFQPIMTKAILPTFGGTAGVWVTAMLFFQTMLLIGYLYSYLITRFFSRRLQSAVHLALLLFSLSLLPVKLHLALPAQGPELSIVLMRLVSVGLPYFLPSSTS